MDKEPLGDACPRSSPRCGVMDGMAPARMLTVQGCDGSALPHGARAGTLCGGSDDSSCTHSPSPFPRRANVARSKQARSKCGSNALATRPPKSDFPRAARHDKAGSVTWPMYVAAACRMHRQQRPHTRVFRGTPRHGPRNGVTRKVRSSVVLDEDDSPQPDDRRPGWRPSDAMDERKAHAAEVTHGSYVDGAGS